mmetsp:Transcript_2368/g.3725  ORF Transcript_2368/g.3725 Transcript_2368/m.3725 type:complete len:270 (+) Transcript_2368:28-837(+)
MFYKSIAFIFILFFSVVFGRHLSAWQVSNDHRQNKISHTNSRSSPCGSVRATSRNNFKASSELKSILKVCRGGNSTSDSSPTVPTPYNDSVEQSSTPPTPPTPPPASTKKHFRIVNMFSFSSFFSNLLSGLLNDPDILRITSQSLSTIVWMYLALSILGTFGIDTKPFVSILGLAGLTFGFSLKDLLSDLYAGVFVLLMHPFERGSVIDVNGLKGRVLSMDIRYAKLLNEADENEEIFLPLSIVYKSDIKVKKYRSTRPVHSTASRREE